MKYARVPHPGNVVVEVYDEPPEFHPDVMATIHEAPDEVEIGWTYQGGTYAPPEPPAPPPLDGVQAAQVDALDAHLETYLRRGFSYSGKSYPLTAQGFKKQDMVRRGPPTENGKVLTTHGERVQLAPNQRQPWANAADAELARLLDVRDGHVEGIMATTTPEDAAAYDFTTGWPSAPLPQ